MNKIVNIWNTISAENKRKYVKVFHCEGRKLVRTAMTLLCVACMTTSCGVSHTETLTKSEEKALSSLYATACDYLKIRPSAQSTEDMIRVIRVADIADDAGDVLMESCDYDTVVDIVWPNGYGNE